VARFRLVRLMERGAVLTGGPIPL